MIDEDIVSIELVPGWTPSSVKNRLDASIARCSALQASVGYCTVDDRFFAKGVSHRLPAPNGFLCVDIHSPTDIDALAALAKSGADIRIMATQISGDHGAGSRAKIGLLHTKMLLFVSDGDEAELWVGSHNWTPRALLGLNIEASTVIRLKRNSRLFYDSANYLQKIKTATEPFDLNKVGFYKSLQGKTKSISVPLMMLHGANVNEMERESIYVFTSDPTDIAVLTTNSKTVYIDIEDEMSRVKYQYKAVVKASGTLDGLTVVKCRHTLKRGMENRSYLTPVSEIGSLSNAVASTFSHLKVIGRVSRVARETEGGAGVWCDEEGTVGPLMDRMQPHDQAALFGTRKVKVQVPAIIRPKQKTRSGSIVQIGTLSGDEINAVG